MPANRSDLLVLKRGADHLKCRVDDLPRLAIPATRAVLNAAALASGLEVDTVYWITDEARLAVATSSSAYQAMAKQGEGGAGGGVWYAQTVTLPDGFGVLEYEQVVAAAGMLAGTPIAVMLAPALDADENDPELNDLVTLIAAAEAGAVRFKLTFSAPMSGPIKLHWRA
jgi:hypothetical protein